MLMPAPKSGKISCMKLTPVILSGGSGTRLWPVSRKQFPKQFCHLLDKSLQTLTLERLASVGSAIIVAGQDQKTLTEKHIQATPLAQISKVIYEPFGKNTAPAVALACRYLQIQNRSEEIVGIFASDALILKNDEFYKTIQTAVDYLSSEPEVVVTLGLKPSYPETGFGYIQTESTVLNQVSAVKKFHEKPDLETAQKFLNQGGFFWNAGIFLFKVSSMIKWFSEIQPELWKKMSQLESDFSNLKEIYEGLKSVSIDYAIIEKLDAHKIRCIPCDLGWSDLGSWEAVTAAAKGVAKQEVSAHNNHVFSKEKKVYSFVGCEDLNVIDTADALLVVKKGESQKVKDLVEKLNKENPKIINEHVFEHRPWGQYEILREENYFKSKIIVVDPGQKISYQSHSQRAEHWIVVKGQAVVVLDDQQIVKKQGEHIFIPKGAKHRIMNLTESPLEFIEVQVGTYFGEDDIVRYQDDYGRK